MMASMNTSNISTGTGMLVSPRLLSTSNLLKQEETRDLSENSVEKDKSEKKLNVVELKSQFNINQLSNESIQDTGRSSAPFTI